MNSATHEDRMPITRRNLLRRLGAGAAVASIPSLGTFARDAMRSSSRPTESVGPILLNRNENPYGPSEKVVAAIREASASANRYPDAEVLANQLAAFHGVAPERVILGCGSSEIIHMAALAFLGPHKKLMMAQPTFELIGFYAEPAGAELLRVPLTKTFSHDLDAMLARADGATSLVYICNPNNPTASLTPRQDLEAFIRKLPGTTTILIDEAYHHFAGQASTYASFIDRPMNDDRVIVARTFSKVYGLAGLRVGYAVAAPEITEKLWPERIQFNVNVVGAQAASAALSDTEYVTMSVKRNADDRQEFLNQANARMLRVIDSHANFVMLNVDRPARETVEYFKKNGVLVAPPIPLLDKYIRVSLGTPAEMQTFWHVWDTIPKNKILM